MGAHRDSGASIASHDAVQTRVDTTVQHIGRDTNEACATRYAIFSECPQCGHALHPEHAHYKCGGCGWRDSCCD